MSKEKQLITDNYRIDNAVTELFSSLKVYTTNYGHKSKVIILGEKKDHIYGVNGERLHLTTPILIKQLESMITQLKESKQLKLTAIIREEKDNEN